MKTNKILRQTLLIIVAIILIDQITKVYVKLTMLPGDFIKVIDDILKIHFIENPGAAFGLTITEIINSIASSLGTNFAVTPETGKIILNFLSLIILAVVIIAYIKAVKRQHRFAYILALIIAGAIGNLIDRLFYGIIFRNINEYEGGFFLGRVVDMIYVDIWKGFVPDWVPIIGGQYYSLWPIFNVADMSISIAIILLILFPKKFLPTNK